MNILEYFNQECNNADKDKPSYIESEICFKDISIIKKKNEKTDEIKYFYNKDNFQNGYGFDSKEECYAIVQKFKLKMMFRNKDLQK